MRLAIEVLQGGFDALDDRLGGVDLAGLAAHAAEADLDVLGELLEDGHVAGAGGGELHGDVADLEAAELLEDGVVAAAVVGFAAGPAPARRQRWTASSTPVMPSTTWLSISTAKSAA